MRANRRAQKHLLELFNLHKTNISEVQLDMTSSFLKMGRRVAQWQALP